MPLPISLPYTFANATTAIPLANLDSDLVTLRDGINGIGNGTNALSNVSITGGNVVVTTANATTINATTSNISGNATVGGNLTVTGGLIPSSSYLRNRIINGDMRIDQRNAGAAVTPSSAAIAYCIDRFYTAASSAVSGTVSVQQVATSTPGESLNCARISRTSGTFTGSVYIGQTIETNNCYDLAGKSVTISFRARKGSAYSASTIGVNCYTGTAANQGSASGVAGTWTGWANAGNTNFTPTTSFATYSLTVSIGASVQEIQINIVTGAFSGSGSANDYVEVTDVQLEVGTVATPFERRLYGTELALCQRYFWSSYNTGVAVGTAAAQTGPFLNIGTNGSANTPFITTILPVSMRASPTITTYSPTTGASGKIRLSSGSDINGTSYRTTSNAFLSGPAGTGGTTNEYEWHVTASIEL